MADLKKAIEIIFQGKDVSLGRTIKGIERDIGSVDSAFGGLGGHAANLTKSLAFVGVAAASTAAVFATFAAKEAADFQVAFSEITTLLDINSEAAAQFESDILKFAGGSASGLDQVSSAIYGAISAGTDYKDSIEAVAAAEKLAVGGKAELNDTVNLLIPTLNAFAEQNITAEEAADAFFTTVKDGKTTISELAASFPQLSAAAVSAGVTLDEVLAATAAITAGGAPTSQAITGIKAALSNIIKPSTEAQKTAEALGIKFGVAALKADGFSNFIKKLQDATGGNIETMGKLFGSTEALNAVMILAKDTSGAFAKTLADMDDKAGASDKAFEKMAKTFNYQIGILKSAWQVFLVTVGDPIINVLAPIIKDLSETLSSADASALASTLGETFSTWITALVEFSKNVDLIYKDITDIKDASLLVDFTKWAGDTETIKDVLIAVNTVVQGLALGVALIHDVFVGVANVGNGIANIVQGGITLALLAAAGTARELLNIFGLISGRDFSEPIKKFDDSIFKLKSNLKQLVTDKAPYEFWSDNVVTSFAVIDKAIKGIGTTSKDTTAQTEKGMAAVGDAATTSAKKVEELNKAIGGVSSLPADASTLDKLIASQYKDVRLPPPVISAPTAQAADFSTQQKIQASLEKEEGQKQKLTDKEVELIDKKKELIDVEMENQTSSEGFKIEVNAEGLAPHLEAIFQAVMEFAQVQTNAQGAQFLLALEAEV